MISWWVSLISSLTGAEQILQDLTRLEAGKETSFNEPFDLHAALNDAVNVYRVEATRRQIDFQINPGNAPRLVVGDARKIKTVIANLTSNGDNTSLPFGDTELTSSQL
jgi:signal transduction histidine kinase